jgi:hypothetical protein
VPEDSEGCRSILEALTDTPGLGTLKVDIPSNGSRKARTARLEVRLAQVTLKPPRRRAQAKASAGSEPVSVNVIAATENVPSAGREAISWVLLTSLPVKDFSAAAEKVQWYGKRWGIETWHKVLKSGCKVEDCLLEEAPRLKRYLTLFSLIGVRLMHVAYLARVQPGRPATEVLSAVEIQVLHLRVKKPCPRPRNLRRFGTRCACSAASAGSWGASATGSPGSSCSGAAGCRLYESVEMRHSVQSLGLIGSR